MKALVSIVSLLLSAVLAQAQMGTTSPSSRNLAKAMSDAVDASAEPGSTADAKIMAACASLPPAGGTIDTCGFGAGPQTIAASVTCGSASGPVTINTCAETKFVPGSSDTLMFVLVDGMALKGTLSADVTGVPGWSGAVVANNPASQIPEGSSTTQTRVGQVNCYGVGNTTGDCIRFSANSGARVNYVSVAGVQVHGMANGVLLSANETISGVFGWVNGNWFHNVLCVGTVTCMNLTANGTTSGTQVSENHFLQPQIELLGSSEFMALKTNGTGTGVIRFNEFPGLTPFDPASGGNSITLGSNSFRNQVSGFLCLLACGGGTVTDVSGENVITDWYNGQFNTSISLLNGAGASAGSITAGAFGTQIVLPGTDDLRVYSGNGGLDVRGGTAQDHNLYLGNLDSSNTGRIVFNGPVDVGIGIGGVRLNPGDASHVGLLTFLDATGASHGSIGASAVSQGYLDIYPPATTRHFGNFSVMSGWGGYQIDGNPGAIVTQGKPASSSTACTPPQVMYDANYVYTCVSANQWRRTASAAF
jgi:hypothetical protein